MVVVEMTAAEISSAVGKPKEQNPIEQFHKPPFEKPGPGWVKNKKGTWNRKVLKRKTTEKGVVT